MNEPEKRAIKKCSLCDGRANPDTILCANHTFQWNKTIENQATHILTTNKTCSCDKNSDIQCPVCDHGLGICLVCGAAEIQMEERPCTNHKHIPPTPFN